MRLCLSMPISLPPGQDTRPTLSGILPGLGLAGIGGGGSGQQESRTDWQCAVVYATSTDLRHSGTMSLNRPIKTEERTEDCEKSLSTPRKCLALSKVEISGVLGAILGWAVASFGRRLIIF